jgi:hypothetical protein
MASSLKRLSSPGLKICTRWRAICARRRRRMSSSLLPLNMLPVMTSSQPGLGVNESMGDARRQTRDRYSPVSVLMRTTSPVLTNAGTLATSPVSRVAGLTWAAAVAPLMPGTVSTTFKSTVSGR